MSREIDPRDCQHGQADTEQSVIEQLRAQVQQRESELKQQAGDTLRLIETIKYLRGIAERGSGEKCPDDMTVEAFVLGYVKNLEQNIKQQAEALRLARAALLKCRDGFEYTRQYVGYETLPEIKGWSWYDGDCAAKEALALPDLSTEPLERYRGAVIEECAKVCEDTDQEYNCDGTKRNLNFTCADAIRALKKGEKK